MSNNTISNNPIVDDVLSDELLDVIVDVNNRVSEIVLERDALVAKFNAYADAYNKWISLAKEKSASKTKYDNKLKETREKPDVAYALSQIANEEKFFADNAWPKNDPCVMALQYQKRLVEDVITKACERYSDEYTSLVRAYDSHTNFMRSEECAANKAVYDRLSKGSK